MMDTNVLGNIHLYGLFMPLILKGESRKVVVVTSGLGDIDWTNELELELSSLYSISKAAMNMVTAKFNAQYKKDGVLFVSICPGLVDVDHQQEPREILLSCKILPRSRPTNLDS
jgi:NAD(P)-dependent dehydrogenase (short-subunit alcohol dehydrogenase family)